MGVMGAEVEGTDYSYTADYVQDYDYYEDDNDYADYEAEEYEPDVEYEPDADYNAEEYEPDAEYETDNDEYDPSVDTDYEINDEDAVEDELYCLEEIRAGIVDELNRLEEEIAALEEDSPYLEELLALRDALLAQLALIDGDVLNNKELAPAVADAITGFSATLTHGEQEIDLTSGAQAPLSLSLHNANIQMQALEISTNFSPGAGVRQIEVSLANGLGFQTIDGGAPNRGFRPDNWTFAPSAPLNPFPGTITDLAYVQNQVITQSLTGNVFQPRSGTATVTVAPGTESISLNFGIVLDWAFSATLSSTAPSGGRLDNPIRVRVLEDGAVVNEAILSRYQFTTSVAINTSFGAIQVRNVFPGAEWRWEFGLFFGEVGVSNNRQVGNSGQILHERINKSIRVPREIVAFDSGTGTYMIGARLNPGVTTSLTPDMVAFSVDTSDPNYIILTVYFIQADISVYRTFDMIQIFGTVPAGATPGVYRIQHPVVATDRIVLLNNVGNIQGPSFREGNINVRVAAPTQNRLTARPVVSSGSFSGTPAAAAMAPLGGFGLDNEFAASLTNQAIHVSFPVDTQRLIGVRGFRLPAGTGGIGNVRVTTVFIQSGIDAESNLIFPTDAQGRATIASTPGRTINMPGPFTEVYRNNFGFDLINLSLYHQLAPNEFIATLYFELLGEVVEGAFSGSNSFLSPPTTMNFVYYGRVLSSNPLPANTQMPADIIAGQRQNAISGLIDTCPNGTGISSLPMLRTSARTTMISSAHATFTMGVGTTGLANQTILGGQTLQDVSVRVSDIMHQYFPHVKGVQGVFVYLRSVQDVLEINRNSIRVYWGDVPTQFSVDTLTDSVGNRVYRVRVPNAVVGGRNANMERNPFVEVRFDITASPQTPLITVPLRGLFFASTINPNITINLGFDHGRRVDLIGLPTLPSFYIGPTRGDNRTAANQVVGVPNPAHMLSVRPNPDLVVTTYARQVVGDAAGSWQNYNWETGEGIVGLNPEGQIEYRLNLINSSPGIVDSFYAIIPIPREGDWIRNEMESMHHGLQVSPFEWSMILAGQVPAPPGFRILYAMEYATNRGQTSWFPWNSAWSPATRANIRSVMIESITPIQMGTSVEFILNLEVCPTVDLTTSGQLNLYSAMVFRNFPGMSGHRASEPVGLRLASGIIEGRVFIDEDGTGIIAGAQGRNGVVVRAYDAATGDFITETQTTTIEGVTGSFAILAADPGQVVNVVFVNPNTSQYNFSIMTPPLTLAAGHVRATAEGVIVSQDGVWPHLNVNAGLIPIGGGGTHTVTFNLHGGTGTFPNQTVAHGGFATRPPLNPSHSTSDFINWYTAAEGGVPFNFAITPITGATTIHARWGARSRLPDNITIRPDYEIDEDDDSGDMLITVPDAPGGDITIELPGDGGSMVITIPDPDQDNDHDTVITVPPCSEVYIDEDFNVFVRVPVYPDSEVVIEVPGNGDDITVTVPSPDGPIEIVVPPGSQIDVDEDGNVTITLPPGGPGGTVTMPDGEVKDIPPGGGVTVTQPDGNVTITGNYLWGDVNGDGVVNLTDVMMLLNFYNSGHTNVLPNPGAANWHGFGPQGVTLAHVMQLLNHYNHGTPLPLG